METVNLLKGAVFKIGSHSLGTLIEWKLWTPVIYLLITFSSHSLGTLIEWKLFFVELIHDLFLGCSHSLGTLIEWKLKIQWV